MSATSGGYLLLRDDAVEMRGKPERGETIQIRTGNYDDSPWMEGEVECLLDKQFTVAVKSETPSGRDEDRIYYAFYGSEGYDWRRP